MNCVISDKNIKHGPYNGQSDLICVQNLKESVSVGKVTVSERVLISSRLGKSLNVEDFICPNHRYKFGVHWNPSKTCCHPDGCALKGHRAITSDQYTKIKCKFGKFSVAIGGLLCQKHRTDDLLKKSVDTELLKSFETAEANLKVVREIFGQENGHHVLKSNKVGIF